MNAYEVFLPAAAADGVFVAASESSAWMKAAAVRVTKAGGVTFVGGGVDGEIVADLPVAAMPRLEALAAVPVVVLAVGGVVAARMLPCEVGA